MLGDGELCVCQLTAVLGLAPSTVSAHLLELKRAGVILEEKRSKFVFYSLSSDREVRGWYEQAIAKLSRDPSVVADRGLVRRIRCVPVEDFAASGSDVSLLPARPATTPRRRRGAGKGARRSG